MKPIITLTLLVLCTLATASEDRGNFCQSFAGLVELSAKARDDGATRNELEAAIKNEEMEEYRRKMALASVDIVFTYPKRPPQEEGNSAYEYCMTKDE